MARRNGPLQRLTFGDRIPWAVGLLLTITVITSLTAALASRHVLPLFELGSLVAERVFRGEIWRLVTWSVLEPSPLSLLFGCLMLFWFGRDLAGQWGSRRFLTVYVGIALVAAVGTCLLALADKNLLDNPYVGSWPMAEAITVAWGLTFPDRVIRIYFVLPIRGLWVAWGTIVLTAVYAIYAGWDRFVPNLLAEGAMLGWMYRGPALSRGSARWSAWKRDRALAARKARVARAKEGQRMASVHTLRKIEEDDDDPAPLPPEVEGKIVSIFADAAKRKRDGDAKPN